MAGGRFSSSERRGAIAVAVMAVIAVIAFACVKHRHYNEAPQINVVKQSVYKGTAKAKSDSTSSRRPRRAKGTTKRVRKTAEGKERSLRDEQVPY